MLVEIFSAKTKKISVKTNLFIYSFQYHFVVVDHLSTVFNQSLIKTAHTEIDLTIPAINILESSGTILILENTMH